MQVKDNKRMRLHTTSLSEQGENEIKRAVWLHILFIMALPFFLFVLLAIIGGGS